jgi:hypothetical protein
MTWLPRIGFMPAATPGLCDDPHRMDFDGRVLVVQWGRFVFEIFAGRRK